MALKTSIILPGVCRETRPGLNAALIRAVAAGLAWLWQRWEVEVTHREMESGLGSGEMLCWNTRSGE